jgi:hypothetical protein
VPTTARTPASVMNIIFRLAERADGGTGGAARSRLRVIDLANKRLRLNFILPIPLRRYCSKTTAGAGLHLRHGYRGGLQTAPSRFCCLDVAGSQRVWLGVRLNVA